jgi:hypothetical protein
MQIGQIVIKHAVVVKKYGHEHSCFSLNMVERNALRCLRLKFVPQDLVRRIAS